MISVIDIIVIIVLGAAAWLGVRQGLIKQACIAVAVISGLAGAAFAYGKLALLGHGSGIRAALLLLLILTVLFLCYSVALTAALWIARVWRRPKGAGWRRVGTISGSVIATCTAALTLWIVITMFSTSGPVFLQQQFAQAKTLAAIKKVATAPWLFRRIEYVVHPFSAPVAFAANEPTFNSAPTEVDQAYRDLDEAITRTQPAVVKIKAWGCGSTVVGSGFVVGPRLVLTSAHIVAGAERIAIEAGGATFTVEPLWVDSGVDDAVLRTQPDMGITPLRLQPKAMAPGDIGAILGYPENAELQTRDATVLQLLNATGYDIYGQSRINRSVYALRTAIRPGNSGGPFINSKGEVSGIVLGHSYTQDRTGYVIAASQLSPVLERITPNSPAIDTGECTGNK